MMCRSIIHDKQDFVQHGSSRGKGALQEVGQTNGESDDRQGWVGLTGRGKDRAACDIEIGGAMHTAVFVDDSILRKG